MKDKENLDILTQITDWMDKNPAIISLAILIVFVILPQSSDNLLLTNNRVFRILYSVHHFLKNIIILILH
jgi:hypothetical protein